VRLGVVVGMLTAVCIDALMGLASVPWAFAILVHDPARPWPVLGVRVMVLAILLLGASGIGTVVAALGAAGVSFKQPWGVALGWFVVVLHIGFLPLSLPLAYALSHLPFLPEEAR
jgi:hypothetical protein